MQVPQMGMARKGVLTIAKKYDRRSGAQPNKSEHNVPGGYDHLVSLTAELDRDALNIEIRDGWTCAMALLHIAFWDPFVLQRWLEAARSERLTPEPMPDHLVDLVNGALTPLLANLSPSAAPDEACIAAAEVDDLIASLPQRAKGAVRREGRLRLLDRSLHRAEHLAEIVEALGRENFRPEVCDRSDAARQGGDCSALCRIGP